jgi:hypothetical protein
MASGIYAIAHIGDLKLYVGDASNLHSSWPPLLNQLNSGTYPDAVLQDVWNAVGGKRRFSFHTWQDIAGDSSIVGIEQLLRN